MGPRQALLRHPPSQDRIACAVSALGPRRGLGLARRQRRISINTCGVISLTLLMGSVARGLDLQPRKEIDEPTEVVVAKMGSARADHHR